MSKPWEKYQQQSNGQGRPWEKYQAPGSPGVQAIGNTNGPTAAAVNKDETVLDRVKKLVTPEGRDQFAAQTEPLIQEKLKNLSPPGSAQLTVQKLLNTLPAAGMVTGGIMGAPLGPITAVGAAGLGDAAGESLKNMGEQYLLNKPKTTEDLYTKPISGFMEGAGGEAGGQVLGAALEKLLAKGGAASYKSGFKKIDEKLVEKGQRPLSEVLLENGAPHGTTEEVSKSVDQLAQNARAARNEAYKTVNDSGVTIDMGHPLVNAETKLAELRDDPATASLADRLSNFLDKYKDKGQVSIDQLSKWKTRLYKGLPRSAYDQAGNTLPPAREFEKALANDFKDTIEAAGNAAQPGIGDQINKINDDWGVILSSSKPMEAQIRRANTTNFVTPIDMVLAHRPELLALKKAGDLAKTTYARTVAGKALMNASDSGMVTPASKILTQNLSPWAAKVSGKYLEGE